MSTALSIITDAYRESNLIPLGNSPNANQQTEALTRLNNIVFSTIGFEAGDMLDDLTIGGTYDQSSYLTDYIPDNARLQLNLSTPLTFKLDPRPFEGQRVHIVDVKNNMGTYPVTIDGNGRQIEGAATLTLNTNGDNRTWMYRADIGNWVKLSTLLIGDNLPFPSRFDDYFTTMLALRLNPRYGQTMTAETMEALKRSRSMLRGHYHAYKEIRPDLDTRGMTNDELGYPGSSGSDFNVGRPGPWR
jgi:hypothetical protein